MDCLDYHARSEIWIASTVTPGVRFGLLRLSRDVDLRDKDERARGCIVYYIVTRREIFGFLRLSHEECEVWTVQTHVRSVRIGLCRLSRDE